ncbi:hypothetical protein H5410_030436 [Solanum commersonii]|uniref:Uncharacterized protein n=1 Tax=Solanum commersonii TaxID=4109 RepID=A0A9J5YFN8_SOLCO|nr:hypothetical protein H5410_030436 [Solanum commersonii]
MYFWEELNKVVRGIAHTKKLFLGEDFNGHIGTTSRAMMLYKAASSLGIEMKEELYLWWLRLKWITYSLVRVIDLCKDCKVIPRKNLTTQHKLVVMVLIIDGGGTLYDQLRIKWEDLTNAKGRELGERLVAMGA